jgi:SEC-C motif domain protein
MPQCPCGSKIKFEICCHPFIEQHNVPETPEQLMRSRYTAYTLANTDYILQTMKGKPLQGFNKDESKQWAKKVKWIGLEVIKSYLETPEKGFVAFCATYLEGNQLKLIDELSEFQKEDNSWFYVNGVHSIKKNTTQKIGRNTPCPCGSKKKFKNCHEIYS